MNKFSTRIDNGAVTAALSDDGAIMLRSAVATGDGDDLTAVRPQKALLLTVEDAIRVSAMLLARAATNAEGTVDAAAFKENRATFDKTLREYQNGQPKAAPVKDEDAA